jgi:hypothetical protein
MHFTRINLEAKAKTIVKSFRVGSSCELLPPLEKVKINGLYVLLSETNIMMDMKILLKPKETMALLMKMETKASLGNMLVSAFGQWYLYSLVNIIRFAIFIYFWFLLLDNFFLPFFFPCKLVERLKGKATLVTLSNNPSMHRHLEGVGRTK